MRARWLVLYHFKEEGSIFVATSKPKFRILCVCTDGSIAAIAAEQVQQRCRQLLGDSNVVVEARRLDAAAKQSHDPSTNGSGTMMELLSMKKVGAKTCKRIRRGYYQLLIASDAAAKRRLVVMGAATSSVWCLLGYRNPSDPSDEGLVSYLVPASNEALTALVTQGIEAVPNGAFGRVVQPLACD